MKVFDRNAEMTGTRLRLIDGARLDPSFRTIFEAHDMPDLLKLVKDGQEITADRSQLQALKADGWSELGKEPTPESQNVTTEGVQHGGEQHPGGPLDSEHRSGGHAEESSDDPVGI